MQSEIGRKRNKKGRTKRNIGFAGDDRINVFDDLQSENTEDGHKF